MSEKKFGTRINTVKNRAKRMAAPRELAAFAMTLTLFGATPAKAEARHDKVLSLPKVERQLDKMFQQKQLTTALYYGVVRGSRATIDSTGGTQIQQRTYLDPLIIDRRNPKDLYGVERAPQLGQAALCAIDRTTQKASCMSDKTVTMFFPAMKEGHNHPDPKYVRDIDIYGVKFTRFQQRDINGHIPGGRGLNFDTPYNPFEDPGAPLLDIDENLMPVAIDVTGVGKG